MPVVRINGDRVMRVELRENTTFRIKKVSAFSGCSNAALEEGGSHLGPVHT